jgi:hypothetical protein
MLTDEAGSTASWMAESVPDIAGFGLSTTGMAMLSARARNLAFSILVCYAWVFPAATKIAAQTEADRKA